MRILITGGCGFIGSILCIFLTKKKYDLLKGKFTWEECSANTLDLYKKIIN